ncbi:hypothetical protein D3C71_2171490 [compost metagenome]
MPQRTGQLQNCVMRAQLHAFEHLLNARAADYKRIIVTRNGEGVISFSFQLIHFTL